MAGWPRRCFERLGDAGTRGIARVSWSCISSCCCATQTSQAMSGPPSGIAASLKAIFARFSSFAPKGQRQTRLGQSDQRERRPRISSGRDPGPEGAKQSCASRCVALSGLAKPVDSTPRALPRAGLSVPLRGGKNGAFRGRVRSVSRTRALVMCDFRSGGVASHHVRDHAYRRRTDVPCPMVRSKG